MDFLLLITENTLIKVHGFNVSDNEIFLAIVYLLLFLLYNRSGALLVVLDEWKLFVDKFNRIPCCWMQVSTWSNVAKYGRRFDVMEAAN